MEMDPVLFSDEICQELPGLSFDVIARSGSIRDTILAGIGVIVLK